QRRGRRQRRRRRGRARPGPGLPGPAGGKLVRAVGAKTSGTALLVLLCGASWAAAAPTATVQPATSTVLPSDSVSATVEVANVTDAHAFQFDLAYGATLLRLPSVTNGGFLPDAHFSPGPPGPGGSVAYIYNLLTGPVPGLSGGGTLVTLTFDTFADRFGT